MEALEREQKNVAGGDQRRLNQIDLERRARIHEKKFSDIRNCTVRHRIESE